MRTISIVTASACVMLPMTSSFITPFTTVHVQQKQKQALSALMTLSAVPNNNENATSTTLFSSISPGINEEEQINTTPISDSSDQNTAFDMQAFGIQALVAAIAITIVGSTVEAISNQLATQMGNLAHSTPSAIGGSLKLIGGMAWEGTKVAAPAVVGAVVEGAKQFGQVAAPVVQDAAQKFGEAAGPVIIDATQQISDVASPYIDSVQSSVSETVVAPFSSAVGAVSSQAADAVSSTVGSVSSQAAEVVAPFSSAVGAVSSQAVGAVSSTVNSVSSQAAEVVAPIRNAADAVSNAVDETLAPIKAVGESIPFRVF